MGVNTCRTSFNTFFSLVPLFPLSIAVTYYSSAVYSSRNHCLCLLVLRRPTNPPLAQEDALQKVCGDLFLATCGCLQQRRPHQALLSGAALLFASCGNQAQRKMSVQVLGNQTGSFGPSFTSAQVLQDQPWMPGIRLQAWCYVWFQIQCMYLTKAGLGVRLRTKWERPKPLLWETNQTKDTGCCQKL